MEYLNTLGEDKSTGAILHVDEVPRGNACNCICVVCHNDLQARQGEERGHHFKHISGNECKPETILHKLAKRILSDNNSFNLPGSKGYFYYDKVLEEQWLDNQKPDIIISNSNTSIHIEIAVTSFINKVKLQKIVHADLNTIEIDLSKISGDCNYEDLKRMIIHETVHKNIIHWKNESPALSPENNKAYPWLRAVGMFLLITWLVRRSRK